MAALFRQISSCPSYAGFAASPRGEALYHFKLSLRYKDGELAKKYSDCPSKRSGGDLGWFGRGMMVKEFEDAAFNAQKGATVGPVKTQIGWHLIKGLEEK